jgi:hypothetical protein
MISTAAPAAQGNEPDWGTRLWHAFANQYNLILLAGVLGLSVAVQSWLPAQVALGAEVAWLLIAPLIGPFRRHSSARSRRAQEAARMAAVMAATRGFDPALAARIQAAAGLCEEIRRLADDRGLAAALRGRQGDRLQMLLGRLLEMADVHERLARFAAGGAAAGKEEEVLRLGQDLAAEKDPGVRLSLRQALTAAQWRVSQLEWIETTRRALEAKSRALEISLDCARTWMFAGASQVDIAAGLDEAAEAASVVESLSAEAAVRLAPAAAQRSHS